MCFEDFVEKFSEYLAKEEENFDPSKTTTIVKKMTEALTSYYDIRPADKEALVAKFKAENCSVFEAAANGYVEDVITPSATRAKLASALDMLIGKRVQRLPKKHNNLFI